MSWRSRAYIRLIGGVVLMTGHSQPISVRQAMRPLAMPNAAGERQPIGEDVGC